MHKADPLHKEYIPKLCVSPGIGSGYLNRADCVINGYKDDSETKETYTTRQGLKLPLPIYYRNKIYNEEEREKLWVQKLDKNLRYVLGQKVDISTTEGENDYFRMLREAQIKNLKMGYNGGEENWEEREYEIERRKLKQKEYISKLGKD